MSNGTVIAADHAAGYVETRTVPRTGAGAIASSWIIMTFTANRLDRTSHERGHAGYRDSLS